AGRPGGRQQHGFSCEHLRYSIARDVIAALAPGSPWRPGNVASIVYCFLDPSGPNCSRYAMTSLRFCASFRPGKIIFVWGTTFWGLVRYLSSSSGVQTIPESLLAGE